MDKIEFALYLKELREKRGFTTRQVERYSGVSNSYISLLENGKRDIPKPDVLRRLAPVYKVSFEDLMKAAGHLYENEIVEISNLPAELKDLGLEYYTANKEAKESGISSEDLIKIVRTIKGLGRS